MYEIVTLSQLKTWLKITDTNQDSFLEDLRKSVGVSIENYVNRNLITRQYTQQYDGVSKLELSLDQYPVYDNGSNFSYWQDSDRAFGSSTLIATDDYYIDVDSGIIEGLDVSILLGRRVNKVTFWAGLSRFVIYADQNDFLDVTDTGGTVAIQLTAGTYIAETLATEIQSKLNANATLDGVYTVTYSHLTQKFTIACDISFTLKWQDGTNALKSVGSTLGYVITANDTGTSLTADNGVTGLPQDISLAAQIIVHKFYDQSRQSGVASQNVTRKEIGGDVTIAYRHGDLPEEAKKILDKYCRESVA